jgi:hypothetical protein
MDSFVAFWGVLLVLFVAVIFSIIFFSYWIPKKLGKKKLGLWISGIVTVAILLFIISFIFEDELFSKSDAKGLLQEHNLHLSDDFNIVSNESGGFRDYTHMFELKISNDDRQKLINQIKSAHNFQSDMQDGFELKTEHERYSTIDTFFTAHYHDTSKYVYEFYKPNKRGYVPTWDKVSISKTENKLRFQRILD